MRGQLAAVEKAKTDPVFLAVPSEHNSVSVIDELALLAVWENERLRATPGYLKHGAE
jgi:hypothetical protein